MRKYSLTDVMPFGEFKGLTIKRMLEEEIALINYLISSRCPTFHIYRPAIERYFISLEDFHINYEVEDFLYRKLPGFRFNSKFRSIREEKEERHWEDVHNAYEDKLFVRGLKHNSLALHGCDACGESLCMCSDPY